LINKLYIDTRQIFSHFSAVIFCSNVKETRFFIWYYSWNCFPAFFINKNRWERKKS